MLANSMDAEEMRYQANHEHKPGVINDIFDEGRTQVCVAGVPWC